MQKTKVTSLCIAAAITYGIVHDQITARLCVEYFTIAHPPLFHTTSPALLGICWGIAATVGIGALLGVVLALVSESEGLPPTPIQQLFRSLCALLLIMAIAAAAAGVLGFELSRRSLIGFPSALEGLISSDRRDRFMAVWFAHGASYLFGLGGGSLIILRLWLARGRPRVLSILPRSKMAFVRALMLALIAAAVVWYRFSAW